MGLTAAGKAEYAGLVGNTGSKTAFTYLELGTGTTAFAKSQTALVSAITDSGLERAAATVSLVTTTDSNDTLQLYKQWTATGSKTVGEIGTFNAASSGTMGNRTVASPTKAVTSGDTLTGTYKIVFA